LVSLANAPMAGEPPLSAAATPFAMTFVNQQMYVHVTITSARIIDGTITIRVYIEIFNAESMYSTHPLMRTENLG
jgi:hypothetical protein